MLYPESIALANPTPKNARVRSIGTEHAHTHGLFYLPPHLPFSLFYRRNQHPDPKLFGTFIHRRLSLLAFLFLSVHYPIPNHSDLN